MAKQKDQKTPYCSICAQRKVSGTTEVYVIQDGMDRHFFNVDKARRLVADQRPLISLAHRTIRKIVALNYYDPDHLDHVEPRKPGIVLRRFGGLVLLDGIHRAVRSLRDKSSFYVQVLSYEESLRCIVRQEIASHDPHSIVRKLRKVLQSDPHAGPVEAEIECGESVLEEVRSMLTPQEKKRLFLRAVGVLKRKNDI